MSQFPQAALRDLYRKAYMYIALRPKCVAQGGKRKFLRSLHRQVEPTGLTPWRQCLEWAEPCPHGLALVGMGDRLERRVGELDLAVTE